MNESQGIIFFKLLHLDNGRLAVCFLMLTWGGPYASIQEVRASAGGFGAVDIIHQCEFVIVGPTLPPVLYGVPFHNCDLVPVSPIPCQPEERVG